MIPEDIMRYIDAYIADTNKRIKNEPEKVTDKDRLMLHAMKEIKEGKATYTINFPDKAGQKGYTRFFYRFDTIRQSNSGYAGTIIGIHGYDPQYNSSSSMTGFFKDWEAVEVTYQTYLDILKATS